jgi:hypothetical protein
MQRFLTKHICNDWQQKSKHVLSQQQTAHTNTELKPLHFLRLNVVWFQSVWKYTKKPYKNNLQIMEVLQIKIWNNILEFNDGEQHVTEFLHSNAFGYWWTSISVVAVVSGQ